MRINTTRNGLIRRFAAYMALALILDLALCFSIFELHREKSLNEIATQQKGMISGLTGYSSDVFRRMHGDLRILSSQSEFVASLDARKLHDLLAREYVEIADAIPLFVRIRLLDADGREILHIAAGERGAYIRRPLAETAVEDRRLVREALSPDDGRFVMSQVSTERDRGMGEGFVPVVTVAAPTALSPEGHPRVIAATYDLTKVFYRLRRIAEVASVNFMAVNRNGYWLSSTEAAVNWGPSAADEAGSTMACFFPKTWDAILGRWNGSFISDEGWFVFSTIRPSEAGFASFGPDGGERPGGNDWILISHLTPQAIHDISVRTARDMAFTAITILLTSGLCAWMAVLYAERRRAREAALIARATRDSLTGLSNRADFDSALARALAFWDREGESCALVFIDLDDFKGVNDTFSHEAGDDVLRETARRLRACCRETDLVARLGGDEFIILIFPCRTPEAAESVRSKAEAALADGPPPFPGASRMIAASLGVARCPEHGIDAEMLLHSADQAMYGAKRRRHGRRHIRHVISDLKS